MATPRRRELLISLQMDEVLADLERERAEASAKMGFLSPPAREQQLQRSPPKLPNAARCLRFCRFCSACVAGGCASLAPDGMAALEAVAVLLLYMLAVPNALLTRVRPSAWHFSFAGSAEDVVALCLLRALVVAGGHAAGLGQRVPSRPLYLPAAALFAAACLPLTLMKAAALVLHSSWPRAAWPPFLALYALAFCLSVLHVLAAQRLAEWARRRHKAALGGWGWPVAEGEEAWLLAGELQGSAAAAAAEQGWGGECGGAGGGAAGTEDVEPLALADADSCFVDCGWGLVVHYKVAAPPAGAAASGGGGPVGDTALVLVHSFGGGAFSWRHVMQPLADASGLPVLAFDRPGFGLTARPPLPPGTPPEANPYALKAQAVLVLRLCAVLGLRRVALVGHADGALLALMAAAAALRGQGSPPPSRGTSLEPGGGASGDVPVPGTALSGQPGSGSSGDGGGDGGGGGGCGGVAATLDWAWMGSQADKEGLLRRLLRGDWPASLPGWHGHLPDGNSGGGGLFTLPPKPPLVWAGPRYNRLLLSPPPKLAPRTGSGEADQAAAAAAAAAPAATGVQQGGGPPAGKPSWGQLLPAEEPPAIGVHLNVSYLSPSSSATETSAGTGGGGGGGGGGGDCGDSGAAAQVLSNPSFLASSSSSADVDAGLLPAPGNGRGRPGSEAAAAAGDVSLGPDVQARSHPGAEGVPAALTGPWEDGRAAAAAFAGPGGGCAAPAVLGLALLHPDLSGQVTIHFFCLHPCFMSLFLLSVHWGLQLHA